MPYCCWWWWQGHWHHLHLMCAQFFLSFAINFPMVIGLTISTRGGQQDAFWKHYSRFSKLERSDELWVSPVKSFPRILSISMAVSLSWSSCERFREKCGPKLCIIVQICRTFWQRLSLFATAILTICVGCLKERIWLACCYSEVSRRHKAIRVCEVLTALLLKSHVFWYVILCR